MTLLLPFIAMIFLCGFFFFIKRAGEADNSASLNVAGAFACACVCVTIAMIGTKADAVDANTRAVDSHASGQTLKGLSK